MATESIVATTTREEPHDNLTGAIPVLAGHFTHDIYTGAIAPLLPVLIEKLSLSLTAAGSLNAIMQLPGLLNPLIGYMADRASVRYFIILAPAMTATLISLVGLAPNYATVAILLFAAGISTAAFHAPAPAMVARVAGKRVGLGMGLFMATGELGIAVGPLLAVWAVSTWTLEGIWRLMFLGWAVSLLLFLRLRKVAASPQKPGSLRAMLPSIWVVFIPIIFFNLFRNPLIESLTTYLPTFMSAKGAGLWAAGISLTVVELAGIPGSLLLGPISDRVGRKRTLAAASLLASLLMLLFLRVEGWLLLPVLALLGFAAFATMPVMLAIVQEQFPSNRAVANGLFMMVVFVIRPVGTLLVGMLGDYFGLETAYFISALISFLMLPAIMALPATRRD